MPVRVALDPVAVPLALHIGAFPYAAVIVALDPVAVPLALHIGAFIYREGQALDPVAVPLALHIGAFIYYTPAPPPRSTQSPCFWPSWKPARFFRLIYFGHYSRPR